MVLSDAESLRHAIIVLRHDLDRLAAEIQALRASETYRTLKDLADWDAYFDEQRLTLDATVLRLEDDLAQMAEQAADSDDGEARERGRLRNLLSSRSGVALDLGAYRAIRCRVGLGGAVGQCGAALESGSA